MIKYWMNTYTKTRCLTTDIDNRFKFKQGSSSGLVVPRILNKKYEPNGYCYYQNIITTLQTLPSKLKIKQQLPLIFARLVDPTGFIKNLSICRRSIILYEWRGELRDPLDHNWTSQIIKASLYLRKRIGLMSNIVRGRIRHWFLVLFIPFVTINLSDVLQVTQMSSRRINIFFLNFFFTITS